MKMELKDYANVLATAVEARLDGRYNVNVMDVDKGNGVIYKGLRLDNGSGISPLIYVNVFWDYDLEIDKAAEKVIEIYKNSMDNKPIEMDFPFNRLINWDFVKDKIVFELVGKERNEGLGDDYVTLNYLDFVIIYQILINSDGRGEPKIKVSRDLFKYWNVTEGELFQAAMKNSSVLRKAEVKTMGNILEEFVEGIEIEDIDNDASMFILTNSRRNCGAGCLLYPNVLEYIKGKVGNFVVLPSSIHETIIVPFDEPDARSIRDFKNMVTTINMTEVSEEEILTDSVYYFGDDNHLRKIA
jgi:hypothetical protein